MGGSVSKLGELWAYRELLYFLTWRDVKVRYKQTVFGAAWAIIQPFVLMIVLSALFGRFAGTSPGGESAGVPNPIFFYAGIVPWTLFSGALVGSSASVVGGQSLVTKVYFPRIILPIAATGTYLIDFAIAMVVLIGMMIFYGIAPTLAILWLPIFTLIAVVASLGIGIGMSSPQREIPGCKIRRGVRGADLVLPVSRHVPGEQLIRTRRGPPTL